MAEPLPPGSYNEPCCGFVICWHREWSRSPLLEPRRASTTSRHCWTTTSLTSTWVAWVRLELRAGVDPVGGLLAGLRLSRPEYLAAMWLDDEDAQAARVRKHAVNLPAASFSDHLMFTCRRLSSSVWNGCRLMSSCASSLRVTEQGTERETSGGTGKATTPTAAPTLPPPYTSAAPTMGAAAAAEATTPAMVGTFQPMEEWGRAALTSDPSSCPLRSQLWSYKRFWDGFGAQGWAERLVPGWRRPGRVSALPGRTLALSRLEACTTCT